MPKDTAVKIVSLCKAAMDYTDKPTAEDRLASLETTMSKVISVISAEYNLKDIK